MSEENGQSGKIKVVDRRWFTDGGELRDDRPVTPPSAPPKPAAPPPPSKPQPASEASGTDARTTAPLFLELVETLAQQAELFLVGAQGLPRQPEQARRLIDYLGVLETKTRGNLSAEETQILSNVVFQLRSVFLRAGK